MHVIANYDARAAEIGVSQAQHVVMPLKQFLHFDVIHMCWCYCLGVFNLLFPAMLFLFGYV